MTSTTLVGYSSRRSTDEDEEDVRLSVLRAEPGDRADGEERRRLQGEDQRARYRPRHRLIAIDRVEPLRLPVSA